jgi:phasin family protein
MARRPGENGPTTAINQAADEGAKMGERTVDAATTAAQAGVRSVSETAAQTAGQARRSIEQLSAEGEAAARRSQQTLAAATDAGGAMMQGAQEISQAWMDLAQTRMQHMAEGMRALAACRTPADLIKAQSQLLQEAMEQMADTNRRVTDVSMRVMQEVSGKVSAPLKVKPR